MLEEVVGKTLKHHGISVEHKCYEACSKRLFDISKFYLKVGYFAATFSVFPFHAPFTMFGCLSLCHGLDSLHSYCSESLPGLLASELKQKFK